MVSFSLDCLTLKPIYKGSPSVKCSYCGSVSAPTSKGTPCDTCGVSTVRTPLSLPLPFPCCLAVLYSSSDSVTSCLLSSSHLFIYFSSITYSATPIYPTLVPTCCHHSFPPLPNSYSFSFSFSLKNILSFISSPFLSCSNLLQ